MKRKIYYVTYKRNKQNNAGMKAPEDIYKICDMLGYLPVEVPSFPKDKHYFYKRFWQMVVLPMILRKAFKNIEENSVIVLQYPIYTAPIYEKAFEALKKKKNVRIIALIHDLKELQGGIVVALKDRRINAGKRILRQCDCLICHNEKMKEYLVQQGISSEKLVCLGIFDYLTRTKDRKIGKADNPSIAIAGNLLPEKSEYIYKLFEHSKKNESDLAGHLFGSGFAESRAVPGMFYHGSFPPDEIADHLEGDFGVVWDGDSCDTCKGKTGSYLRYNCPHKTSLYLASGMPVIIWSHAAMADFVKENGVGLTVDSLENLGKVIASVDDESYVRMCENARKIGKRLREGYYFRRAMDEALKRLES